MPAVSAASARISAQSRHQRLVGLARPVPFEHGEFGMVQRAALAVAVDMGEAGDARLARRQQLLAGEFRRGVEIERRAARRRGRWPRSRRRADAPRCPARPAAWPYRPRRNPALAKKPRRAAWIRLRAEQERAPVGMDMRRPPGGGSGHEGCIQFANGVPASVRLAICAKIGYVRRRNMFSASLGAGRPAPHDAPLSRHKEGFP